MSFAKWPSNVAAAVILLAPLLAGAASTEGPAACGDVKFHSKLKDVKALHPDMETVREPNKEARGPNGLPDINYTQTLVKDQKFGDLSCNVYLTFFEDYFVKCDLYCGEKEKVQAYLISQYGEPRKPAENSWIWGNENIVTFNPSSGIFALTNKESNDAFQGRLMLYHMMATGRQQGAPEGKSFTDLVVEAQKKGTLPVSEPTKPAAKGSGKSKEKVQEKAQ